MVDLRSYPLPRSVAARLEIGHPADTGCTGNDPARAARGAARISENRPCAGPHGPDADRDYCRVLALVTGGSAQTPLPNLYRAVDKQGKTAYLSRTRDVTAAKALFRKALKRHGEPRVITLDGFEATHAALRRMGMNNEFNYRWDGAVQIRNCPYLNNVLEQVTGG